MDMYSSLWSSQPVAHKVFLLKQWILKPPHEVNKMGLHLKIRKKQLIIYLNPPSRIDWMSGRFHMISIVIRNVPHRGGSSWENDTHNDCCSTRVGTWLLRSAKLRDIFRPQILQRHVFLMVKTLVCHTFLVMPNTPHRFAYLWHWNPWFGWHDLWLMLLDPQNSCCWKCGGKCACELVGNYD